MAKNAKQRRQPTQPAMDFMEDAAHAKAQAPGMRVEEARERGYRVVIMDWANGRLCRSCKHCNVEANCRVLNIDTTWIEATECAAFAGASPSSKAA